MKLEFAERVVSGLRQAGVNFVSYLPESRMPEIIPLLEQDGSFQLVRTGHEGTAVSIASGAAYVGKQAAVYMEGTGLYTSTYNVQTVPIRSMLPLLLLVSYIGSFADTHNSFTFAGYGQRIPALLDALGILYQVVDNAERLEDKIVDAVRTANSLKLPACLLFTGELTG